MSNSEANCRKKKVLAWFCMILIATNPGFSRDSTSVAGKPTVFKLYLKNALSLKANS